MIYRRSPGVFFVVRTYSALPEFFLKNYFLNLFKWQENITPGRKNFFCSWMHFVIFLQAS